MKHVAEAQLVQDKVEYATYHKRTNGKWYHAGITNCHEKVLADHDTAIMNTRLQFAHLGETYATAKVVTRVTLV